MVDAPVEITDLSIPFDEIITVEYFLIHCVCVRLEEHPEGGSWVLRWADQFYDFDWIDVRPPTLMEAIRLMVNDSQAG